MSAELKAVALLNERFLLDYPSEAARALEGMPANAAIEVLQSSSPAAQLRCWQALSPDLAAEVLAALPAESAQTLLAGSDPQAVVAALAHVDLARRATLLAAVPEPGGSLLLSFALSSMLLKRRTRFRPHRCHNRFARAEFLDG